MNTADETHGRRFGDGVQDGVGDEVRGDGVVDRRVGDELGRGGGDAGRGAVSTCAVAVDVALLTIRDDCLRLLLIEPDTPQLAGRRAR